MENKQAIDALSALAQETRLAAFRMLIQAGTAGIAAGTMARQLGVPANTLSANLSVLTHAGLIAWRREGRSIIYIADYNAMAALLGFLMEDCCGGSPQICAPLAGILARAACCNAGRDAV